MSTKQSTVDYILDQLVSLDGDVSVRKMFGEYALYCDGKVVALVCDDTLFVKITNEGKEFVGSSYREGSPYPGAKPAMEIDDDRLEDREWLSELIRVTADALPVSDKKRT
ncbi:MAG: TfoX/Sxy family protein [Candidatus Moranbacteria bacterium]|nr:TfoX/Sxy family protein [Candidatus Moranbacteria bacterium]